MLPLGSEWMKKSVRIFRFAIVGLIGMALYTSVVWTSISILHIDTILAVSVGFVAVVMLNYALHYNWTFRSVKSHRIAFIQFAVTSIVGFSINFFLIYTGVSLFRLNYLAVQIPALGLVVTSNYLLSALWVFRVEPTKFPAG
jgi:putative flippase GtrA